MDMSGQLHASATLTRRNGLRYSSNRRLSGSFGREKSVPPCVIK